ncbi:hypothetical protein, partial [Citrobacter freundii]|uniref:hypothetical protein n=1 Tax=Citrobacter freundii TaxID=546 RepID=UPI001BCA6DF9
FSVTALFRKFRHPLYARSVIPAMGENTPFTIMPISPEIAEILWSAAYLTIQTREPFSLFRTNGNLLNPNGEIVLESQG